MKKKYTNGCGHNVCFKGVNLFPGDSMYYDDNVESTKTMEESEKPKKKLKKTQRGE